jgi:hypothetical protein
MPAARAVARRPSSVAATAGVRMGCGRRGGAAMALSRGRLVDDVFTGTPTRSLHAGAVAPDGTAKRFRKASPSAPYPGTPGELGTLHAGSAWRPVPVSAARGPSPRPPTCGWGGAAGRAASRNVGERPLRRDADAQPARLWRGCGGRCFRMPAFRFAPPDARRPSPLARRRHHQRADGRCAPCGNKAQPSPMCKHKMVGSGAAIWRPR